MLKVWVLLSILVVTTLNFTQGYLTVVTVHGINSDEGSFDPMVPHIENVHPGTRVVKLPYSPNQYSLDPLFAQLRSFNRAMEKVMESIAGNIHLVCHSQGKFYDSIVCLSYPQCSLKVHRSIFKHAALRPCIPTTVR